MATTLYVEKMGSKVSIKKSRYQFRFLALLICALTYLTCIVSFIRIDPGDGIEWFYNVVLLLPIVSMLLIAVREGLYVETVWVEDGILKICVKDFIRSSLFEFNTKDVNGLRYSPIPLNDADSPSVVDGCRNLSRMGVLIFDYQNKTIRFGCSMDEQSAVSAVSEIEKMLKKV